MVGLSRKMSVRIETYLPLIKLSSLLDSEGALSPPNFLSPVIGIELEYLEKNTRRDRNVFILALSS